MKIFVVEGHCGEYSDHRDWPVKAFTSEFGAKQLVAKATRRAEEIYALAQANTGHYWVPYNERVNPLYINEFDPNMETDYTGTTYQYFEIDLDMSHYA